MLIQWQCICHSAAGDYPLSTLISELTWTADHSRTLGVMPSSLQIQASPLLVMLCAGDTKISLWPKVVQEITDDIDNWSRPANTWKSRTILVCLIHPTFHCHMGNEKLGLSAKLFYVAEMMQLMKIIRKINEAGDLVQDVYTSGQPTYVSTYVGTLPHRTPIAICLSPWDRPSTLCWGKATKFAIHNGELSSRSRR